MEIMKKCPKCGIEKEPSGFSNDSSRKDGKTYLCKPCDKIKVDQWRKNNRPKYLESLQKYLKANSKRIKSVQKKYSQTKAGKEAARRSSSKQRILYPEKYRCSQIFLCAVRSGKIEKQPCEMCEAEEDIQGHHYDYSKPLDVNWLCRKCHRFLHHYL